MTDSWPLNWLTDRLRYEPVDMALFRAALTHRSASGRNNERLEFLGDAVLNLVVAEELYQRYPAASEGDLSRLRARVVSGEPLAEVAQSIGLGDALRLGSGELKTGGFRRESILADGLEAVVGAVFLDRGLDAARQILIRLLTPRIASAPDSTQLKDAKTRLQERLQAQGLPLPHYWVDSVSGEPHAQQFRVRCEVASLAVHGEGGGSSRRRAEQDAAQRVLETLDMQAEA